MVDSAVSGIIEMGINLLAISALVIAMTTSLWVSQQINEKVIDNQLVTEEIKDQRNNIYFNGTDVYAQDIINQVVKYQGDRGITVELLDGNVLTWDKVTNATDYTISSVSRAIPRDAVYHSELVRSVDGYNVIGYRFTQFVP